MRRFGWKFHYKSKIHTMAQHYSFPTLDEQEVIDVFAELQIPLTKEVTYPACVLTSLCCVTSFADSLLPNLLKDSCGIFTSDASPCSR